MHSSSESILKLKGSPFKGIAVAHFKVDFGLLLWLFLRGWYKAEESSQTCQSRSDIVGKALPPKASPTETNLNVNHGREKGPKIGKWYLRKILHGKNLSAGKPNPTKFWWEYLGKIFLGKLGSVQPTLVVFLHLHYEAINIISGLFWHNNLLKHHSESYAHALTHITNYQNLV